MKKAISIWSFPNGYDIRRFIGISRAAGFQGVELAMSETGELSLSSEDNALAELKVFAEKSEIEIHSLVSNLAWKYSAADDILFERKRAYETTARQIRVAQLLGAGSIVFMMGPVYSKLFRPEKAPVRYDIALERNYEILKKLKPIAEEHQICVAIENVWNMLCHSPVEMRSMIDSIGSPFVGACFDVGNVMPYGFPEHWIEILGKRIKRIHFKDFRLNATNLDGFVDLLSGDVNWPAVTDAIKHIEYDGWITAETGPYLYYSEQQAYNASKNIDAIFKNSSFI